MASIGPLDSVIIINCNEDDEEIDRLTKHVYNRESGLLGKNCVVLKLNEIDNYNKAAKKAIFVSHHSFYTPNGEPKSIRDRRVGDFTLFQVAEKQSKLVKINKTREFQYYGCEMALNEDTRHMYRSPQEREEVKTFRISGNFSELVTNLISKRFDTKISSLAFLAASAFGYSKKERIMDTISLRGLTGVGCISEDAIPRSFDREHLHILGKIREKRGQIAHEKHAKKIDAYKVDLDRLQQQLERAVDTFDSPTQIEFVMWK